MLRSSLRAHCGGLVATTLIAAFLCFVCGAGFGVSAGHTAAERAQFGRQMSELGVELAYLTPLPIHPETPGGYTQWRAYGFLSVVFGFWALMAACGAVRREEERGLVEAWLASGAGRVRYVATHFAAFALVATAAIAATAGATLAGAAAGGFSLPLDSLAELSVALLGLTLACFSVGLLAAQFAARYGSAAGLGGVVLLALFMLNSLARTSSSIRVADLSPFHLYDRTTILAPGGVFDVPATIVLFGLGIVLAGLAGPAFARRDLREPLLRLGRGRARVVRRPAANPLLRVPALASLYEQRLSLLWWMLGVAGLALLVMSSARSSADLLTGNPTFRPYLQLARVADPYMWLVGLFWFGLAELVLALYAVTQAGRWAADDAEGRLEMTIAQPVARWRVVLDRAAALLLASGAIAAVGSLSIAAQAPGQGVHLDGGRLVVATALLLPVALSFGAMGALLTAWLPRLAVPVLAAVAVASYLGGQFGPMFRLPSWALRLSLFQLYGTPLTSGVSWSGTWALVGIAVTGFGAAIVAIRWREVGR